MAVAAKSLDKMPASRQIVHIVEDDELFRLSLQDLFLSLSIEADVFGDASDFFSRASRGTGGCVLLDVRLPGVNGIEFQRELETRGYELPVIFMTAHGDVATSVNAMKAGAVDFLQKPLRTYELLDAIRTAFAIDSGQQEQRAYRQIIRERAETLTPREKQVLGLVTSGLMNKQVAYELGISEIMVKLHRGSVMRKMEATSLAELVRQFEMLD
ncbi:response regulator transcription factor [Agrobacterium radiobacter]|uniref:response regulator transcription factor n=1 Tax=Agrobacterium radiobacter TaxID=362 RepID=UPI000760CD9E|nr:MULTISPECIES: response regulator [Agrobacterium tumefaciens complex]KAB0456405.1 response regulator transcription factor [Agrobacterium tumefaciens]KWT79404.1 two-component system response regulator [Agrobacterium radiobacter]MBB4408697.1 FixJ family two-component response regulator [Agrobacterium radiobacter]MBB4454392.1 FixJ family two-component response regulator [Agrobacterium radiobacter]NIB12676.1 response regulator transcription factor [Agrobacterium radiobacter]